MKTKMENATQIYEEVKELVHELGVPVHIKGYEYLVTAITLAVENPNVLKSITKELVPLVAEKHQIIEKRVESEIRHAIQVAWDRGALNDYFGDAVKDKKPTNAKFITTVANNVSLKYGAQ